MTELADWCACETLWLLRRGREPRTLSVDTLIARDLGRELHDDKRLLEPDMPVRWTRSIPDARTAAVVVDDLGREVGRQFRALGERLTGYRSETYDAHESSSDHGLSWWLLDVGSRASPTAWLDCAAVAQQRGERVDRLGVVRIALPSSGRPAGGGATLETRAAAPVMRELELVRERQGLCGRDLPAARTPGLHCRRCPEESCPCRAS